MYKKIGEKTGMDVVIYQRKNELDVVVTAPAGRGTLPFWMEYGKHQQRGPVGRAVAAGVWEVRRRIPRKKSPKPQA